MIVEALARGEVIAISGLGTYSTRDRTARRRRDPATSYAISIAASQAPAFKAEKMLRGDINTRTGIRYR